jgi:hypothetical protein
VFHFVMVTVLLGCIVHMPMAVPDAQIDREEIVSSITVFFPSQKLTSLTLGQNHLSGRLQLSIELDHIPLGVSNCQTCTAHCSSFCNCDA